MKKALILSVSLVLMGFLAFLIYRDEEQKPPKDELMLYGNVDVRQVDIGFRISGRLVEMPFEEGDLVRKGQLLATLDDQPYLDRVRQAQATVESARIQLKNAEKLLQRRQELIDDGSISKEDLENAVTSRDALAANLKQSEAALGATETDLKDIKVFSPTDGSILTRVREIGSVVRQGDPVYTLSIASPVWIRTFIPENYLGVIYPEMAAEIYTDTQGGKVYHGKVGFISPVSEFTPKSVETAQLRTDLVYRVRIYVQNPDRGLRQGMPVTVKIRIPKDPLDG